MYYALTHVTVTVAWWYHLVSYIWVSIDLGNILLPDGIKPLVSHFTHLYSHTCGLTIFLFQPHIFVASANENIIMVVILFEFEADKHREYC